MILRNGTIDRNGLPKLPEEPEASLVFLRSVSTRIYFVIGQCQERHELPPYSLNPGPPAPLPVSSSRTPRVTQSAYIEPVPKASVNQLHILHKGRDTIAGTCCSYYPGMTSFDAPRSKEHFTLIPKYRPSDSTRRAAKHGRRTRHMLRSARATGRCRWTLRVREMPGTPHRRPRF